MIFKLRQIKIIREQRAFVHLGQKQQQQQLALTQLTQSQSALADYMLWQKEEINRRYQEIIGQSMQINELSDFNYDISSYKIKQVSLEQKIAEAEQTLTKKNEQLAQAKHEYGQAQLQSQKFLELTRDESAKRQKLALLIEDQALDEFLVRPRAGLS